MLSILNLALTRRICSTVDVFTVICMPRGPSRRGTLGTRSSCSIFNKYFSNGAILIFNFNTLPSIIFFRMSEKNKKRNKSTNVKASWFDP